MSILESIKSEKKLSLNHWRYRILHWAFNVNESNCQAVMPPFLYTHYCPLFHLTNLIAILSPIILLIKIIVAVIFAALAILDLIPFNKIWNFFARFVPNQLPLPITSITVEMILEEERKKCVDLICKYHYSSFERFWEISSFTFLNREAAEEIYNKYMPRIEEARRLAKLRKEKWRQRIIFWTNFSRVFIKWIMNIAYVGLGCLLLYLIYDFSGVAWRILCWIGEVIYWLFTDSISFAMLLFIGKLVLWFGLAIGLAVLLASLGVVQRFMTVLYEGLVYITLPFYILLVPFRWLKAGFKNLCEFVSMFYEENCPPIKIVTEEEAIIESIAQNEEGA